MAILSDLVRHATFRVYNVIGDACQLIDHSDKQHRLVLSVLASLTYSAASMLYEGKHEPTQDDLDSTLAMVRRILKDVEDANSV